LLKKENFVSITLITLCLTFQLLANGGIGIFLPDIRRDLGLSYTEGGALSAAAQLVYALMQIPSGYLSDRYGSRRLFFYGALGTTIFCLALGLSAMYWQGIASQVMSGFFRSMLFVPGLSLLIAWFKPEQRATAISLSGIGVFLGQILITTLGPSLAAGFDWRFPFITFAAAGIVFSLAFIIFSKEPPYTPPRQKTDIREVLQLFRYPVMLVFGGLQFIRLSILEGLLYWLPSLLINEKGISLQVTGLIMALRSFISVPANILGGFTSDKTKKPTFIIGVSLVILAVTTALIVHIDDIGLLIGIAMINAFFVQFYFGPLYSLPLDILDRRLTGTATGFGNFFANMGSFTFALLLGWIKDTTGSFNIGFYILAGTCIIGLVLTLILKKMRAKFE
jgi:sugar phosphate permease